MAAEGTVEAATPGGEAPSQGTSPGRPGSAPLVGSGSFRNLLQGGFAMQCEEDEVEARQRVADDRAAEEADADPVSPHRWHGLVRALSKGGLFEMRAESGPEAAAAEVEAGGDVKAAEGTAIVGDARADDDNDEADVEVDVDAEVDDAEVAAAANPASMVVRPGGSGSLRLLDCTQGEILSAERELALWKLLEGCGLIPAKDPHDHHQQQEEDEEQEEEEDGEWADW